MTRVPPAVARRGKESHRWWLNVWATNETVGRDNAFDGGQVTSDRRSEPDGPPWRWVVGEHPDGRRVVFGPFARKLAGAIFWDCKQRGVVGVQWRIAERDPAAVHSAASGTSAKNVDSFVSRETPLADEAVRRPR